MFTTKIFGNDSVICSTIREMIGALGAGLGNLVQMIGLQLIGAP